MIPEHRVNAKFVHFVDEHDQIMTEHFAQSFVHHRNIGLAAERVAKLPFHHRERGFNIAALVVSLQELLATEHEVVVHVAERAADPASWGLAHSRHLI
jgi:hypothetical protein